MASIQKVGGVYRAFVCRKNSDGETVRKSATFDSKREAQDWAAAAEIEIKDGRLAKRSARTFGDVLREYRAKVSTTKKGARWEEIRIDLILRDPLAAVNLDDLDATHVSDWRDRRLKDVSAASVRREWTILSAAANAAIKEWRWLRTNPFSEVRRPERPDDRDRLFACLETEAIVTALGWDDGIEPTTISQRVAYALLYAMETGMRCGEVCAMRVGDLTEMVAIVRAQDAGAGKSRAAKRRVPMTRYAREIASIMKAGKTEEDSLFDLKPAQVDALFRKARDRCGIVDLHFHDSRANAITMLAGRMDIMDLARAIGHSDLKKLLVYYRKTADDIARGW